MYITSREEEVFQNFSPIVKWIAAEIEDNGGEWGVWLNDGALEVAECSDFESCTRYFQMDVPVDIIDIAVRSVRKEISDASCGHSFDCCGCWFLSGLRAVKMYPLLENSSTHVFIESWGRNV